MADPADVGPGTRRELVMKLANPNLLIIDEFGMINLTPNVSEEEKNIDKEQ